MEQLNHQELEFIILQASKEFFITGGIRNGCDERYNFEVLNTALNNGAVFIGAQEIETIYKDSNQAILGTKKNPTIIEFNGHKLIVQLVYYKEELLINNNMPNFTLRNHIIFVCKECCSSIICGGLIMHNMIDNYNELDDIKKICHELYGYNLYKFHRLFDIEAIFHEGIRSKFGKSTCNDVIIENIL